MNNQTEKHYDAMAEESEDVQEFIEAMDKSYKSCMLYILIIFLIGAVALAFKCKG